MWQSPENVIENPTLHNRSPVFADRPDAGARLALLMGEWVNRDAVICAIPAGGVPVGVPLAEALGLSLDVLVVSKMTLPWNTEAGFGAVAADGTMEINRPIVDAMGLDRGTIERGIESTSKKVAFRERRYREIIEKRNFTGTAVILVDDGLASGFTMHVAIQSAKSRGAGQVVVAVPTGHESSVESVAHACDRLYCANIREGLRFAVASAYVVWSDVSEDEVERQLMKVHQCRNT